jgi:hypothetical protein
MKNVTKPSPPPDWQLRRARILQRVCQGILRAAARGVKRERIIRRFGAYWDGRPLGERHRLHLSPGNLRRCFDLWRHNGQTPEVFRLKFRPGKPALPLSVILKFVDYIARGRHGTLLGAARAFRTLPVHRHLAPVNFYWTVSRYLPASRYRAILAQHRTIARARAEIARLHQTFKHDLRARLRPAKT